MNQQLPHIDDFILQLQADNFSPKTIYSYERDLKVFENFLNQDINKLFKNFEKTDLLRFKAYLTSQDRKTAGQDTPQKVLGAVSINRVLCSLRSYLKFLEEIDFKTLITSTNVKLIKTEKKHGKVPELEEILRLLDAPEKYEHDERVALRNKAMLETLFATGMRISELLSLKVNQVNKSGRIYILGKGKKQRFAYLTPRALIHVRNYLIRRNSTSEMLFVPYRGKNVSKKDNRVSTNYLQFKIKRYRELLDINIPVSAHTLRHAFATFLAENGANPAAIQILLGHESLDTTTRYVNASDRYAEKSHHEFHPLFKDKNEDVNK